MKLFDVFLKKSPRFFYVIAVTIFFANGAFAARTITISSPAMAQTFGFGNSKAVNATSAGFSSSISNIIFTMSPLASQIDFTGSMYSATLAASTLTVGTTVTIRNLIRPWDGFLSTDHE